MRFDFFDSISFDTINDEDAMITASQHIHRLAGSPDVDQAEDVSGICATCAAKIKQGVPISKIENPSFSQHSDFLRYSKYVCSGCAWLYWSGKGKPGNFIAAGERYDQLVISHESVVEDKEPWHKALLRVSDMPLETLVSGVLTTDVKPRLWPRTKLATVGNFGLYVHAPDYDLSAFVSFDLAECLRISTLMRDPLVSGYSKSSIYHGLLTDYARSSKYLSQSFGWETGLKACRDNPAFIPALLISGVTKEDKKDVRSERPGKPVITAGTSGNQHSAPQLELF